MIQILLNLHRTQNYFNGGTVYEIPSGGDGFELEVSPPLGEENISSMQAPHLLAKSKSKPGAEYIR